MLDSARCSVLGLHCARVFERDARGPGAGQGLHPSLREPRGHHHHHPTGPVDKRQCVGARPLGTFSSPNAQQQITNSMEATEGVTAIPAGCPLTNGPDSTLKPHKFHCLALLDPCEYSDRRTHARETHP